MANGEGSAVASLVCGILSWFLCPVVLAIVAIMLGSGNPSGLARAGVILGWLNIAVSLVGFVLMLLMGGVGLLFGA